MHTWENENDEKSIIYFVIVVSLHLLLLCLTCWILNAVISAVVIVEYGVQVCVSIGAHYSVLLQLLVFKSLVKPFYCNQF